METDITRKVRETGVIVSLIRNLDGNTLYCHEHGMTCSWGTKREAMQFFSYPSEWCECCASLVYGE